MVRPTVRMALSKYMFCTLQMVALMARSGVLLMASVLCRSGSVMDGLTAMMAGMKEIVVTHSSHSYLKHTLLHTIEFI